MKSDNIVREDERNDAREMAKFIIDKRADFLLHQIIGVALISYMNGVCDAEHTMPHRVNCNLEKTRTKLSFKEQLNSWLKL